MDDRDATHDDATDETDFGQLPLVGPLLRSLGVQSDESLLALDLADLSARPGVGLRKLRRLASLQEQARRRVPSHAPTAASPSFGEDGHRRLPLVGQLLQELGVSTDEQLLDLDLAALAERKGVGAGKIRQLEELQAEALRRSLDPSPRERAAPGADLPDDLLGRPPREVLGRLSKRLNDILDQEQLATVGDLAAWVAGANPATRRNYGRRTHQEILGKLRALAETGPDALVFGGARPETVQGLAEAYLAYLPEPERTVFRLRYEEGYTLLETGRRFGVTRERARQRLVRALERSRPGWGKVAGELLAPAADHLRASGGVALTEDVLDALGNPIPWTVDLAVHLSGDSALRLEVLPGLSTNLAAEAFEALRRSVRSASVQARGVGAHAAEWERVLADCGLEVHPDRLGDLLERFLSIRIEGTYAWPAARKATARVERALRTAGRPMTTQEVTDAMQSSDLEPGVSTRVVASRLARSASILAFDHGVWIHDDATGWSADSRDAAVRECLPMLRAAGGRAVDAGDLRSRLVRKGLLPHTVTAYMLRDVLVRSGSARTWPSVTDVAYRTPDARRTAIPEWLEEVGAGLPQPADRAELVSLVASKTGYAESSIGIALTNHPGFLGLGDGRFYSVQAVFGGLTSLRTEADRLYQALPPDDLVTPATLQRRVTTPSPLLAAHGPDLWWAALRTHPEVRSRVRGRFAWRADLGSEVAEALWRVGLFEGPDLTYAGFRELLHRRYGVDRSLAWGLQVFLAEAVEAGILVPTSSDGFSLVREVSPPVRTDAA